MNLKGLEREWKKLGLKAARTAMSGEPRSPVPNWRAEAARLLVLRQDRIGDAIVTTGLLRAIRGLSPHLTVDVLASPRNAPILERDESVTQVHRFDKRQARTFPTLAKALRECRYHAVLDCMMTAPSMTSLLLMAVSGAPHRIGLTGRGVDAALTIPVHPLAGTDHIIDQMAAFGTVFGLDPDAVDWRPQLSLSEAERQEAEVRWAAATEVGSRRMLINVSAGRADREWPAGSFVGTIRAIRADYPDIGMAVVGAPSDRKRAESIAAATGVGCVPTPKVADIIGLVATADLVFTPDTSVVHMSSAFRTPAFVMFPSQEGARQWGLYRSPGLCAVADAESLAHLPLERLLPLLRQFVNEVVSGSFSQRNAIRSM